MAELKATNEFEAKDVFIDFQGDLVIVHGEQSVIVDKKQAQELLGLLQKFISDSNLD